jgi:hypothetical protein
VTTNLCERAFQQAEERALRKRRRGDQPKGRPGPDAADGCPTSSAPKFGKAKPVITLSAEEHAVNAAAVAALAADPSLYQRGAMLVRVLRDGSPAAAGVRRPLAPRIEAIPRELLRERLTAVASWVSLRETKIGAQESPAHPPGWCVGAVHARGTWEGIRHLEAVVEYPILRPDGTLLQEPGYDPATGLLLEPAGPLPTIPTRPARADAVRARDRLLGLVSDFPFAGDVYRAAWLAALLTPPARFAVHGPAPLFLVDANVRAAGKGLLLDTIALIATGERFTVATYTDDEDELRKRITSLVLGGDRLVLFDNLGGKFGNATLDAALTATSWRDRMLGINRMVEAPIYATWYATGNNVSIGADTARRICHIRLESPEERPENRRDFRHPDLRSHVQAHRAELLADVLTILRAHAVAGRPGAEQLPAWGSYESWSSVVRAAVVWIGLPDPGATRIVLQDQADVSAGAMGILLDSLRRLDPNGHGLTAAELVALAKGDGEAELRDAVEALAGRLDARTLGNRLRAYRRRIFGGLYLDRAGKAHQAAKWAAFGASEFSAGPKKTPPDSHTPPDTRRECGSLGECLSAQENNDRTADVADDAGLQDYSMPPEGHGDAWEGE